MHIELDTHTECVSFAQLAVESDCPGRIRTLRENAELGLSKAFDRIYRLDTGRILLAACDASGTEVPLREVAAGEFFGEFCFCPEKDAPHDYVVARAVETCGLAEIRAGDFLRFLNGSPRALRAFVASVCCHLASADRRIFALAHRDAERRLCLLLLEMPVNSKTDEINASHSEIAGFAAMSRPHVSLVLSRFRERGLLDYRRQGPILIHRARIRRYLEQLD